MTHKRIAAAAALALAALAIGAVFGQPGAGNAATAAPANTSPPWISGAPQEGATLTATDGAWDGSPTSYAYAWSLCDASGANCTAISGATGKTYTPVTADVGHTLRVTVKATNGGGSTSATSGRSAVVSSAAAPKNTGAPTISGTPQIGSTLTAAEGSWANSPTTLAYAWERCDANGSACVAIAGATNPGYTVTSADAGSTLRVAVTATNGSGSTTATSDATSVVAALAGCPSGTGTIQIADLAAPARLSIVPKGISPQRITRSTRSIQLRFLVTACNGRPVQGATVFAIPIPYEQFGGTQAATDAQGAVTLTESRESRFPASSRQELLAVLARASKPGETLVGGVSTRRVVSFPVALG
jgi:hypothetical protein